MHRPILVRWYVNDSFVAFLIESFFSHAGGSDGTAKMADGEEMLLVERDEGDGWTRVRKMNSSIEGFVPTSYLECKFYPSESWDQQNAYVLFNEQSVLRFVLHI